MGNKSTTDRDVKIAISLTGILLASIFPSGGYHIAKAGLDKGQTKTQIEQEAYKVSTWNFDCYMVNVLSKPGRQLAYFLHGDNE